MPTTRRVRVFTRENYPPTEEVLVAFLDFVADWEADEARLRESARWARQAQMRMPEELLGATIGAVALIQATTPAEA